MQLLGELLFRISGITGKNELTDDEDIETDVVVSETSRKALIEVLGKDRRDRVLSAIYIIRQDASGLVRSVSLHVWKALVQNTPRTVKEILPHLSRSNVAVCFPLSQRPLIIFESRSPTHYSHAVEPRRGSTRGKIS